MDPGHARAGFAYSASVRLVHVLTPGDHYSPRTGSAVPTVVDGLSAARPSAEPRPVVVIARGTYPDRYDSADSIEFDPVPQLHVGPVGQRHLDAALSLVGLPRWGARRWLAASLAAQHEWPHSVVIGHNMPELIPSVDAARHVPVLYAHNDLLRTYRRSEAARVLAPAGAIVCVSDALAQRFTDKLPAGISGRVRVVRNGVDAAAFGRGGPLERQGPLRVVFVGRMIPDKGADVLVSAVRRLDRPDIDLTLVGSSGFSEHDPLTPFERSIRQELAPLGDRARVRPFVPRAEVASLLQTADVAVVPSRWPDPCPLSVLEGMAAGAAVVGSEIGGIPETLRGPGVLVRPGSVEDLAAALEAMADDENYRLGVARSCLAYAQAHDWATASAGLHSALTGLRA